MLKICCHDCGVYGKEKNVRRCVTEYTNLQQIFVDFIWKRDRQRILAVSLVEHRDIFLAISLAIVGRLELILSPAKSCILEEAWRGGKSVNLDRW